MAYKKNVELARRRASVKAENPYVQTSRTQQNNYHPFYFDNINFQQGWNLFKGQMTGIGVANETVLGHSIVSSIVDGSIGTGLSCESAVNEKFFNGDVPHEVIVDVQNRLEALFGLWSKNPVFCDRRHQSNLAELERQAMTLGVSTGECFVLIRIVRNNDGYYLPQIELINPVLVSSPNMVDTKTIISGIEFDSRGREIAYYVKKVESDSPTASDWERIPKYTRSGRLQMIHMKFGVIAPNQVRGTSVLMPLANNLVQIDRFNEANAAKAVIQSAIGFQIVKDKDVIESPNNEVFEDILNAALEDEIANGTPEPRMPNSTVSVKPGMTLDLPAGNKLETVESTAPTVNYWDFINGNLKLMSGGRLPAPEKVLKSYLASYSASQASMQESQRVFELWVSLLADGCLNEIYKQFVWCVASEDLVEIPHFFDSQFHRDAWSECQWFGMALVHNDPVKAVRASILKINAGLSTREIEARNLTGKSWESIINQSAEEMQKVKELGIELTDADKAEVWAEDPEEDDTPNEGGNE